MKFNALPPSTKFFDVEGIAVAVPTVGPCVAFVDGKGLDVESREYPNHAKVRHDGTELSRDEFSQWLKTGKNRFTI